MLTVLMSVYNHDKYLNGAISSVLKQTFKDFKFIIIDDASTDDSSKIIKKYESLDARIIVIRHNNRYGLAESLNEGLELCTSNFVARMDSDDICLPHRFECQIKYLLTHPNVGVVGSSVYLIDDNGNPYATFTPPTDSAIIKKMLQQGTCPLIHPSVMFKRDVVIKSGMYDTSFKRAQDLELWIRLIKNNVIISNISNFLLYYRFNSLQMPSFKRQLDVFRARYRALSIDTKDLHLLNLIKIAIKSFAPVVVPQRILHRIKDTREWIEYLEDYYDKSQPLV